MNKYKVIFDIRKDKILFVFERCEYDDNKILASENLSFLPIMKIISFIITFKLIVENKSDENNSDMNFSKNIKKRSISTLKTFKERMI